MELSLSPLTRKAVSGRAEGRVQTEFDQRRFPGLFLRKCTWHLVLWLRERIVPMSAFICL